MIRLAEYELPLDLWPHQDSGIREAIDAIQQGLRRLLLTSPCGGGKTRIMLELIQWAASGGMDSALYTSRKLLFKQTGNVLERNGIGYGERASGHDTALLRGVQLCMTPSEYSAVYAKKRRTLHPAKLVLIDEIHMQGGGMMERIVQDHLADGAVVIAFTATPLDLAMDFDRLIIAGTNKELRKCGAHVKAIHYCPDTPDLRHIKKYKVGEDLSDKENARAIMRPGVFGRILDNYHIINKDERPSILFGPDVAGSLWFAQQFHAAGIRAAHIDAKTIWIDGAQHESTEELRTQLLEESESGALPILCNRFVLREGIDLPHIGHCIMATVFGSLQSYLQSGGRLIRAFPSLTEVTVQDHGGNSVRHGSLNDDRNWELEQSGYKTTGMRQERLRERPETEPIVCPQCHCVRLSGATCPRCGKVYEKRSRMVVQIDGTLKQMDGPSFRPHYTRRKPDTEQKWQRMYHRAKSKKWDATFNQAVALFFHEEHYYPPRDLPLMPKDPADWFNKVAKVPTERLQ